MKRLTLYGSPYSLPTYNVALMLHPAGEPFSFRDVSVPASSHRWNVRSAANTQCRAKPHHRAMDMKRRIMPP